MADEELLEEQEEISTQAVEPDPSLLDEPGTELDDDFEETTLTSRQKIWIGVSVISSFLLFFVLLFPLDIIIRKLLQNPETGMQADFTSLNLNAFGSDDIQGFQFRAGSFAISSPQVESTVSWIGLMKDDLEGTVTLNGPFDLQAGDVGLQGQKALLKLGLPDSMQQPASTWVGDIELELQGVTFTALPSAIPLPLSPSDLKVSQGRIRMGFDGGGVNFEGSSLQTNLFNIRLTGRGTIRGPLAAMQLNGRICLRPVSDLQQENPAIYDFYTAFGGTGGGELCFKLEGNLSSPKFLPESNPLQNNSNPEAEENPAQAEQPESAENSDEEANPDTGEQEGP
ncbi:MAG: type II secretion system protein GspN [Leptospiraceae bacterium]|nr:type II secretion system protein GspN [Leptospiraceae bacterium]